MSDLEKNVFSELFQEAHQKCFGNHLSNPLSEAESRHFSNEIFEQTGLVLGWKSIKNYALFILDSTNTKQENPSIASLDTLARYVRNAPKTDETNRKKYEPHFSYWFNYKDIQIITYAPKTQEVETSVRKKSWILPISVGIATLAIVVLYFIKMIPKTINFSENFDSLAQNALFQKGWILKDEADVYWQKRTEQQGHLTLFTLAGDNYLDSNRQVGIKNLLLLPINANCFSTEIHISDFMPQHNWQQVGLLLLEDSTYASKSVRLSLCYNDFFGGYAQSPEILVQAINSTLSDFSKPEEIAHLPIFTYNAANSTIIKNNLKKSALRIERNNNNIRLLYATGTPNIFAFKEVISRHLTITPKYIGIFAISGNTSNPSVMPVHIDSFNVKSMACGE